MIIDAHTHLWKAQTGRRDSKPVRSLENGLSDFGGEIRQMMPPYMLDGENSAEMLIANMNYAGVNGAVVMGEVMDGNQDGYFLKAKAK
ncbi:MAG: amidohydrolase, partial [Eubacterium sp.]|nr:amidohydrolase [Eubacterium sp.]